MTINRSNFEAYMLDYLEGSLDPLLTADLMAFLAENPEFEKYIPDYDQRVYLTDSLSYGHKNLLKKDFRDLPEVSAGNFDEFCIAECEGLLPESDVKRLSDYIALHPEKQRDLELYRRIKLQPDATLSFPAKNLLKKRQAAPGMRYLYYALGVAASLALLIVLTLREPPATDVLSGSIAPDPGQTEILLSQPDALPSAGETQTPVTEVPVKRSRQKPVVSPNSGTIPAAELSGQARHLPVLAKLEPVSEMKVIASVPYPPVESHLVAVTRNTEDQTRIITSNSFAETRLGNFLGRIDFWKTAETAISGFNYLTESNISMDRITDESGKLTSLLIQNDRYTITGKIK